MPNTAIVFTCAHVDPEISNERFDLLGKLIYDLRPDYVVDLGDGAYMKSLNRYDTRYPQAIVSQHYENDINHYNYFISFLMLPISKNHDLTLLSCLIF